MFSYALVFATAVKMTSVSGFMVQVPQVNFEPFLVGVLSAVNSHTTGRINLKVALGPGCPLGELEEGLLTVPTRDAQERDVIEMPLDFQHC